MKNTSAVGNAAENFVAEQLESVEYVVASRRHRKGGGDLLAVHPRGEFVHLQDFLLAPILLVEVKGCKPEQLWQNFRRAQREEMKATELPFVESERLLALVKGKKDSRSIDWRREDEWPE